jgi:hypothetical protein
MQIELKSRIGNCAFVLKAAIEIAETLKDLAMNAIKQIVFHDSASEAFKEKSGFKRDSVYSDALSAHVGAIITAKLTKLGFADISFVSSAYDRPTPFSVFEKAMRGLPADVIASTWAIHPNNPANQKAKQEATPASEPAPSAPVSLS